MDSILSFICNIVFPVFKKIGQWLKTIVSNMTFKDWIIFLFAILSLYLFFSCRYYMGKSGDVLILNDSLRVYKNKLGEEYAQKNAYVLTVKQLKEYNKALYDEAQSLRDNPLVVTRTKTTFHVDTIHAVSDTVYMDNTGGVDNYTLGWHADEPNGYYSMNGNTSVASDFSKFSTDITDLTIKDTTTLDVIDNGTVLQVIAKHSNPYVSVDDIESVVIDPSKSKTLKKYFKQKKWGVGPYVGVGVDMRKGVIGPQVGVGITYSLIRF